MIEIIIYTKEDLSVAGFILGDATYIATYSCVVRISCVGRPPSQTYVFLNDS